MEDQASGRIRRLIQSPHHSMIQSWTPPLLTWLSPRVLLLHFCGEHAVVLRFLACSIRWGPRRGHCTDSSGTAKDSAALPRSLMWQTSSILVRASPRFYILHLVSGALRPGPHLHPRQRWTTPVSPLTLRLWPHLHPSRCSCSACDSTYFALVRAHGCRSASHTPPLPIRLLGLNLFFLLRP
jgi:hypothetical protein